MKAPTTVVEAFLARCARVCAEEFASGLREIVALPWWKRWKAKRIAQRALRIGPYKDLPGGVNGVGQ